MGGVEVRRVVRRRSRSAGGRGKPRFPHDLLQRATLTLVELDMQAAS